MEKPLENKAKWPYAYVRDNHGDIQFVPMLIGDNGNCYCNLLPGYQVVSVFDLEVEKITGDSDD